MPKLTVPTPYIKKLKELGIYNEWLDEVKKQWDNGDNCGLNPTSKWYKKYIKECIDEYNWMMFIVYSLDCEESKQGYTYWVDIQKK